jgi:hypothetical protein
LLGILTIETVLLTVYSSQPQRVFSSKSSLHNYRPLRFSRCSHVQQKVLLSSFSASDNVLVTYVLTVKRRGCLEFSTLRSGGPLADGRQVGLDRAPDPGSGLWRRIHKPGVDPSPLRALTGAERGVTCCRGLYLYPPTCYLHMHMWRRPMGRTHAPPRLPCASRLCGKEATELVLAPVGLARHRTKWSCNQIGPPGPPPAHPRCPLDPWGAGWGDIRPCSPSDRTAGHNFWPAARGA